MKTFGFKTLLISGLFVAVQALSAVPAHAGPSLCNGAANGVIDGDEECETGACCTAKCELKSAATVCRAKADAACDIAETCGEQAPTVDAACPADVLADDGTACSDGSFCTANDACSAGECVGGDSPCDDEDACTVDTCVENGHKCQHADAEDGTACEDGSACTSGDTCSNGECAAGEAKECTDDNECTNDSCDDATGECVFDNNTAKCDDGNFCTEDDRCAEGTCGGSERDCDDDNSCTTDSCDEATDSCGHSTNADGTTCDDGQFCTVDDVCTGGVCDGAPNPCDDDNDCTNNECQEASNTCKNFNVLNGSPCDDGSGCTTHDTCLAGQCQAGEARECADDNACTDDSCDAATGDCVFTNNSAPCDDGAFCTTEDVCAGGVCTGGAGNGCDDGDACTTDICDEETDGCTHGNADNGTACEDGSFCTVDDTCTDGVCSGGIANTCDDENSCTTDSCNEGSNVCKHSPTNNNQPCEDGSFCTVDDTCHSGSCTGVARDCGDDNACTDDVCNDDVDACQNTNNSVPCDDGNFCTSNDTCGGGSCSVFTATCDDANGCTDDSCDEGADTCSNVNNTAPCEDGSFCTVSDTCSGGSCASGPARDCGDANACTDDSCNEGTDACDNVNNTDPCDDGQFCTVSDVCAAGACNGTPRDCSDGNVCTNDVCSEATDACTNPNNTAPCDDGLFCTTVDTCAGGVCTGGPANTCDDANGCTNDSCNEGTNACDHANNTDPCDSGVFCTINGTCSAGACVGTARNCADNNDCTDDSCDETGDACVNAPNADPCDDGLFCTTGDACTLGTCLGTNRDCSDSDDCTDDSCNELTDACVSIDNTAPCEDGNFCTSNDVCAGGVCTSGGPNACSDNNDCTDDECDEEDNLCVNTNNTEDCSDANPCTVGDVCADGVCVGVIEDPECTTTTSTSTTTTIGETTTTTEECPVCGDFNGDCEITASDALAVLQAAVGIHECSLSVCDFSGDGKITALDALAVLRAAVGLPSNPSCPAVTPS